MSHPIKAVLFDAYGTLFDVYSVGALAETLFPGHGARLAELWRDKQIDYSRVRALSGRYADFWQITGDALDYAMARLSLAGPEMRERLMAQYARLDPFPENLGALTRLRQMGLPLGTLSNGSPQMLNSAISSAGFAGLLDHVLSVDAVKSFKTAPQTYQMGPDALGLPASQILFVSSNGWDAAGAAWFGYQAFWVNRANAPRERLDATLAGEGRTLDDVVALVSAAG